MNRQTSDIDRGWAWVVLLAAYLGMFIFCLAMYMNGVLYVALLERFQEGEAKTALIGAISIGLQCFTPLVGGVINNKFSCRASIVLGGILTTLGFATSAFVNNFNLLIVTNGACVGLGYGFCASGLICVVGFYFEKWRNTVLSFAFLAVGVGMLASAPLGLFLINSNGLPITFLILACIEAQICILGMLCKPSTIEIKVHRQKKDDQKRNTYKLPNTLFDLTLLRNKSYCQFLMSTSAWTFAISSAILHLPNYVYILGGNSRDIGLLMTTFSVANVFGRLCGAGTISIMSEKSIFIHVTMLAVSGILTSLYPLYAKLTGGTYIFAVQLGIFTGWPNAMMTPLSLSFVGVTKLSEAYAFVCAFSGIGITPGPIVTGYLYSVNKSYEYSFVISGAVLLVGSIFGICSVCCKSSPKETAKDYVVTFSPDMLEKEHCDKQSIDDFDQERNCSLNCSNDEDNDTSEKELFIDIQNST